MKLLANLCSLEKRSSALFAVLLFLLFCGAAPKTSAAAVPKRGPVKGPFAPSPASPTVITPTEVAAPETTSRSRRSVGGGGRHRRRRRIFSESLGAPAHANFTSRLADPCGAAGGGFAPVFLLGDEMDVFSVSGREASVAAVALRNLVQLRLAEPLLVS